METPRTEGAVSLWTVGAIARHLRTTVDAVRHVIRSRRIRPIQSATNVRIFDDAAVARIAGEVRRIRQERESRGL